MLKIKKMKKEGFRVAVVPITYYKSTKLERALERLFVEVDKAYKDGADLLAVSAVHQHLVATKKQTSLSLILESGEPREVHHFATLLGYGACAVNPYLALDTIHELIEEEMLDKDYYAAVEDYTLAILHGIVKISSKMGISTIQSYQGAKIFEAIGISKEVTDKYFAGTVSRVGGITMEDIEKQVDEYHTKAFDPLGLTTNLALESMGKHKRRADGEEHRYNPETIHLLQQATWTGNYELFKEYTKKIDAEETGYLRSLMDFAWIPQIQKQTDVLPSNRLHPEDLV